MSMDIGKRILRLFDPKGERERMNMREWRCIAEASAEDLTRTVVCNKEKFAALASANKNNGGRQ